MADAGPRLEEHDETLRTQLHREVLIHEMDRVKPLIEAAHEVPGCSAYKERAAATTVYSSNASECVGRRRVSDERHGGVAPHYHPGVLKAAIEVEHLATNRAGFGMRIRRLDQGFHPAELHLCIVVQQEEQLAAREIAAAVA
jgi:hypothetical protein